MASMARLDPEPSVRIIRSGGYLNKQLIAICQSEGLNKVGVKAELQQRIIEKIQSYAVKNDAARFERLRHNIENPNAIQTGLQHASMSGPVNANAYLNATNNHPGLNIGGVNGYRGFGGQQRLEFKPSPFYTVEQQLGETKHCEVMQHHRHTVSLSLRASDHSALARVAREPSLKVLVFCAGEPHGRQDVAFPHQSEIKVNGGEIKANLRGLKNKPGSTRPVDITKELRLTPPTYSNTVELTYALTTKAGPEFHKKFYFLIYVVKSIPVADLVKKLEAGKRITEKSILDEMGTKARDTDIMTTASVLSLKCPLSTLRIDLPIRSISCRHNQCFDGTSYLQLQEQGPTWLCPICNNSAPFESLAVDEYVKDILKKTSKSVDQVIVQPDGKWDINAKKATSSNPKPTGFSDDSDDDLIEITKSGDSVRMGTPQVFKTPATSLAGRSREPSSSSVAAKGSTSGKRSISAVIDLTSSGDEDEEPVAPPSKRTNTNMNGFGAIPSMPNGPAYRPSPHSNGYHPQ